MNIPETIKAIEMEIEARIDEKCLAEYRQRGGSFYFVIRLRDGYEATSAIFSWFKEDVFQIPSGMVEHVVSEFCSKYLREYIPKDPPAYERQDPKMEIMTPTALEAFILKTVRKAMNGDRDEQ